MPDTLAARLTADIGHRHHGTAAAARPFTLDNSYTNDRALDMAAPAILT